ncbi:beta-N-acetylglucosaminidase domain-containing protein [Paenibacillus antri]|nr:beta-N-acetylglucosaminidase domain-containing protein [Paenibacillus antri]
MTMMFLSKHRVFHVLLYITFIVGLCTPAAPNAANATPVVPLPRVSPPPQSMESNGASITLPKQAKLVFGMGADLTAVALVRETLENHGVRINDKAGNFEIYVGGPEETPESEGILAKLGREGPEALPADGYVLAIERSQGIKIVLSGKDATGTYYAALTMSQLIQRQGESVRLPAVYIRDYPNFPFRGGEESFYGPQWSWEDRYDQVDFLSEHKMNYFFYGPAEDDRTTGRAWRDLYPPEELEKFRRLVEYSRAKHVNFLYRIGPESPQIGGSALGICHARTADRDALIQRLEQMYSIGVRTFVISWDDVTETFTCEEDAQRYGSGPIALATAQAEVLNDIQERFFDVFPDVERGITIPSQYWLNEPTPYRSTFDELVTESMDFYWTGPHVMSLRWKSRSRMSLLRNRHSLVTDFLSSIIIRSTIITGIDYCSAR